MSEKEAKARIKINKLLKDAGWRFFDDATGKANIVLEPNVKIVQSRIDALGENFEKTSKGFIDFLLLDEKGFPFIVLEAKSEDKNPLVGKEQARKYAKSQNCRFVILSNGNLHYFWDLNHGNPHIITRFPRPDSVASYTRFQPNPDRLVSESIGSDYIALTQHPSYANEAGWKNEDERPEFIKKNRLRFLREYQINAVKSIQTAVSQGASRFLFEMATGTGKTLIAAAVIKLFIRTGNARRVLFLVDRLELEDQANKTFIQQLKNDISSVIYKESRDDWRKAEIVVTTVQSLLFNSKFERLFSPTDFDLVISDEAHRSIGGNARAVFDYFLGYKLGLTATPRDYLKKFQKVDANGNNPRELERRLLLDTYRTFGCEDSQPTFRYSLLDGVKEGFLVSPTIVDARTGITTNLLSEQGFIVSFTDTEGENKEEAFKQREFEKRFFSPATNQLFCKTFLENALRDPISGEIGKSIIFAVSQNHAAKLAQILNIMADKMFPGKYQSDFALQVTSQITDAQQSTINFTNNNLLGSGNFIPEYKTSKARICVTVGMMTTGYDCPDILNLGLFRPIFSPTDFIQIKGRGTRKHNFLDQLFDDGIKNSVKEPQKKAFKLFDFFANCEYFEEKFNYDQVIKLPKFPSAGKDPGEGEGTGKQPGKIGTYAHLGADIINSIREVEIGFNGMKIDRMFFQKFEDKVKEDPVVKKQVEAEHWEQATEYVIKNLFDKPEEYFNLDKLRVAAGVDRRLTVLEVLQKAFGFIPRFKPKDELLEEAFDQFVLDRKPEEPKQIMPMKYFFKAYITDSQVRQIIDERKLADLNTHSGFDMSDFKSVPKEWRSRIPEYIKDYVPLNQFI
jgi:type I restriction enzyme R subunit